MLNGVSILQTTYPFSIICQTLCLLVPCTGRGLGGCFVDWHSTAAPIILSPSLRNVSGTMSTIGLLRLL